MATTVEEKWAPWPENVTGQGCVDRSQAKRQTRYEFREQGKVIATSGVAQLAGIGRSFACCKSCGGFAAQSVHQTDGGETVGLLANTESVFSKFTSFRMDLSPYLDIPPYIVARNLNKRFRDFAYSRLDDDTFC